MLTKKHFVNNKLSGSTAFWLESLKIYSKKMHHPLYVGVCGAHIENNFSEFFHFRYKLFFIIEKSRSSLETIGELLVVKTAPVANPLPPQEVVMEIHYSYFHYKKYQKRAVIYPTDNKN